MLVLRKMTLCLLRKNPFTDLLEILKHARSEILRTSHKPGFYEIPFGNYAGKDVMAALKLSLAPQPMASGTLRSRSPSPFARVG
jgi:hypothetical protein